MTQAGITGYNFKCNLIEYHRMNLLVKKFLKTYKNGNVFQYSRPTRSTLMQSLTKSKKGSKDFYNVFLSEEFECLWPATNLY